MCIFSLGVSSMFYVFLVFSFLIVTGGAPNKCFESLNPRILESLNLGPNTAQGAPRPAEMSVEGMRLPG